MRTAAIMVVAALALPVGLMAEEKPAAPATKATIFCADPKFDFGKVVQGKAVEHTFVIENKGAAPLNILSVQPSCGCTTAPISQNTVEPGKTTEIKAKFDSSRADGSVHKTINVSSNDPDNPGYTLEITGTVIKLYETVPPRVNFNRVNKSAEFETQLTLKGNEGRKPKVTGVSLEGDTNFDTRYVKKEDADEYVVFVKLKPGAEAHYVNANVVITLEDPDVPRLQVPFNGQISSDVIFFPPRIQFGTLKPKDVLPRRVVITVDNPKVSVESVEVDPPVFAATAMPHTAGPTNTTEYQLQVKDGAPVGDVQGKVIIHTTSKEQSVVTIPISGKISTQ